jgi:putative transposase
MKLGNTPNKTVVVYRLYPTKEQESTLLLTLDLTWKLYNIALTERKEAWKRHKKNLSAYDQMYALPYLKKTRPEFQKVYAQVLQQTLIQVEQTFNRFFAKVRLKEKATYPQVVERGEWTSFTFPQVVVGTKWQGPGKLRENGTVKIPKIGDVRIDVHRPLEGTPKALTISYQNEQWYALYSCDVPPT